jgi:Lon protease-like protein
MPLAPPFRLDESGWVANRWGEILPVAMQVKQELLLVPDPTERLARVQTLLQERDLLP